MDTKVNMSFIELWSDFGTKVKILFLSKKISMLTLLNLMTDEGDPFQISI